MREIARFFGAFLFATVVNAQTADLELTATANPPSIVTGETFTLTLKVRNFGPDAGGGTLSEISFERSAAIILSITTPPDWVCADRDSLPCTIASIPVGGETTLLVKLLMIPVYPAGQGTATFMPNVNDVSPTNNHRVPFTLTISRAPATVDLAISLRMRRNPVEPGTAAVIDITVTNGGNDVAPSAYVLLTGPAGMRATGSGWTCDHRERSILCHGGVIAPNAASTMTMTSPPGVNGEFMSFGAMVSAERAVDTNFPNNFGGASASFGNAADYELLLVPLTVVRVPGALGSVWSTEVRLVTDEDVTIFPRAVNCAIPEGCPKRTITPGALYDPLYDIVTNYDNIPGSLVYTRRGDADKLHFTLRLRDVSRPGASWGTTIPIARERDFRASRITIADVPIDPAFRVTLRVYDPDRRIAPSAIIRYVDDGGNLLSETRHAFTRTNLDLPLTPALLLLFPAYIQIDVAGEAGPLLGRDGRITVQIDPAEAGQRLWAFVSVTSNETQQVTVLTDY